MTTPNVDETLPSEISPQVKPKKRSRIWIIVFGIILILLLGAAGAYLGYGQAMQARAAYSVTQIAGEALHQFTLAEEDRLSGRYENARLRYERVIQLNPNFPGAMEGLAEVVLKLSITNTPTFAPTPTLTPTPDLRGAEALYTQSRQFLAEGNWQGAFDTLEALRKEDLTYKPVDVDGMMFVALNNLGIQRITSGNLEMGLYTLALAERFGYLDSTAQGLRNVARLYITGASFWEVDWSQASYYFEQIYPYYPNLIDVNAVTARERFRQATIEYGDQLGLAGDYCNAVIQYEKVLALGSDGAVETALNKAREECSGGAAEEATQPPVTETTAAPTAETPVVTETTPVVEQPTVETTPSVETTVEPSVPTQETTPGG